jgi:DNA-binding NarL/FixJ family response regulator
MILAAVRDLLFRSKIDAAARRLGVEVAFAPRDTPLSAAARSRPPELVLADLGEAGAMDELRAIRTELPGVRVVGYLGHLRTDLRDEALGLGVEEVLTRGQLAASLDDVLLRGTARG